MEKFLISYKLALNISRNMPYGNEVDKKNLCSNLTGYRFEVAAICSAPLYTQELNQVEVRDFDFLKKEMYQIIHAVCDHTTIIWSGDKYLPYLLNEQDQKDMIKIDNDKVSWIGELPWKGVGMFGRIYVIPYLPISENLARFWFCLLKEKIKTHYDKAELVQIKVWETPNWCTIYPYRDLD